MREIRKLPAVEERVETGAVQFGDDWPGLFIRGDDAFGYALALRAALIILEGEGTRDMDVSDEIVVLQPLRGLRDMIMGDVTGMSERIAEPAVEPPPGGGDLGADDSSEITREDG